MTTAVDDIRTSPIFEGIYDVPEAARYLKASVHGDVVYPVTSTKLIRWIRKGLVSPGLSADPGRDLLIAFEDLVSLRIIAALRAVEVGWAEICRTEKWLREQTGAPRPFATEYLWAGHGRIFIDWTQRLISGSRGGQLALEMLREYLIPTPGLMFCEETHVAMSWEPLSGILLEPQVQFGTPCLTGTRIPTRTIAGMVEAGDSVDWVAEAFGLTPDDVKVACDWETRLGAE